MKILLFIASVAFGSDFNNSENLTLQSHLTIKNCSYPIYDYLQVNPKIDPEVHAEIHKYLRLYKYIPHTYTPMIEENKNFVIDTQWQKMLEGTQHVIVKTHPLFNQNPIICVIAVLNKQQADADEFKSHLYDLNKQIIKKELKKRIF